MKLGLYKNTRFGQEFRIVKVLKTRIHILLKDDSQKSYPRNVIELGIKKNQIVRIDE